MKIEIFKLFGSILIDDKEADKSLSKMDKKTKSFGERLSGGLKTAAKWGAGLALAGGAAAGAMFGMATKAGDMADRLLDLNSITGMSTDEIQRWEKVTKIAGVSTDAMTNASQKLTKSLDTMVNSGGKGAESLEALGLSVDEISNMNADERMNAITEALAGVEDKTERAKLGTDLLGGSWKDIAPIVDMGAEAMQNAKDSANIISEDDLVKANNFRISMEEMKDQAGHLFMMLAINVIPIFQTFLDWIQKHMPKIQAVTQKAFEIISVAVDKAIEMFKTHLLPVFQSMADWVTKNLPKIEKFFKEAFQLIGEFISAFVVLALKYWDEFGETIMKNAEIAFDTIVSVVKSAFSILQGVLEFFIGLFTGDWGKMGESLEKIWSALWDGIESIVSGAWGILSNSFQKIKSKISEWFTGLKDDALQWGKNMIEGFISGITSKINKVKETASSITKSIGGFLGFNSPAKEGEGRFIEKWGANMIDGFLDGSKSMIPNAKAMMNDVVGAMKPDPHNHKSSTPMSNSSAFTQNITINSPKELSPSEIKRKIDEANRQHAIEWGLT
ncbi:hypothetical protein [Sutcliffiella cohnii]|uniref:phage tail protein n=1 Tax=Sutcliffiella cohnii TaxID=33932 RepID=UPI002E22915C|nr:hypothetical protein [Sutcliffiella cohnii]